MKRKFLSLLKVLMQIAFGDIGRKRSMLLSALDGGIEQPMLPAIPGRKVALMKLFILIDNFA